MSAMSWIRGFNATVGRLAPDLAASKMHRAFLTPRELPPRDWELPLLAEAERVTLRFGLSALRWGQGPGAWAALVSVLLFDYFFVPPIDSFSVNDTQYIFTFCLMLGVALVCGQLTARLRHEARVAAERERLFGQPPPPGPPMAGLR